ncbi:hypothetical protein ACLOJK_012181 [Asimina triloba]
MGNTGSSKASNQLSDLCSIYDSDFKSLFYGKCYHDHILCNPVVSIPPLMPSQLHSKSSKNTLHQSAHLKPKVLQHSSDNAVGPKLYFPPSRYYFKDRPFTCSTSRLKETPKLQGTGTYFPSWYVNLKFSYFEQKEISILFFGSDCIILLACGSF